MFKEYNEVFNNPYEWEMDRDYPALEFHFYDEENSKFEVWFDEEIGSKYYPKKIQEIINKEDGGWLFSFAKNGSTNKQESNAFRVFATLKEIMLKHKNKIKKAPFILFSGISSEKGRISLYRKLGKQMRRTLRYMNYEEVDEGGKTFFILY